MNDTKDPAWLLAFASDTHSQSGEDGIVAKILSMLPETDKWCVEFGAWDGIYLNNARKLIVEEGYAAALIEGDDKKFDELKSNYENNPRVYPIHSFVGYNENDSLDTILNTLEIPKSFDYLSIDIDGNDYHVWKAIKNYKPKIVCIEFNPTIPTEVEFIQPADPAINHSASLLSIYKLGLEKGYELICVTELNAIFVERKYYEFFEIKNNHPFHLRKCTKHVTHIFFSHDGYVHLAGAKRVPWHNISISEKQVQLVPKCLRTYPLSYNKIQRGLYKIWTGIFH